MLQRVTKQRRVLKMGSCVINALEDEDFVLILGRASVPEPKPQQGVVKNMFGQGAVQLGDKQYSLGEINLPPGCFSLSLM